MADRLHMHAQLVHTAGFRRQHKACSVALRIVGKCLVVRQRGLAIDRIDDVPGSVGPVNAKRQIDAAICRGGTALDEGDVTLFDLAMKNILSFWSAIRKIICLIE